VEMTLLKLSACFLERQKFTASEDFWIDYLFRTVFKWLSISAPRCSFDDLRSLCEVPATRACLKCQNKSRSVVSRSRFFMSRRYFGQRRL